jgi:hypothetical protein
VAAVPLQIRFGSPLRVLGYYFAGPAWRRTAASNLPRRNTGRRGGQRKRGNLSAPPASASQEGAVAQLGERLICIQEVAGSIPTSSTSLLSAATVQTGPVAQVARARP